MRAQDFIHVSRIRPSAMRPARGTGENLMIAKSDWWKVAGIPCDGVAKAKLIFRINRNGSTKYTASSDTNGVTFGDRSQEQKASDSGKTYYEVSYEITFGDVSDGSFDITFSNTDSNNNLRVDDIEVTVTELK